MFAINPVLLVPGLVPCAFAADGPLVRTLAPTSGAPILYVMSHLKGEATSFSMSFGEFLSRMDPLRRHDLYILQWWPRRRGVA